MKGANVTNVVRAAIDKATPQADRQAADAYKATLAADRYKAALLAGQPSYEEVLALLAERTEELRVARLPSAFGGKA